MANLVAASIYGLNANDWNRPQGVSMAFPGEGFIARPPEKPTTMSGVTINALIQLLPTGLVVDGPQYYTDKTVAQLVSAANAPLA